MSFFCHFLRINDLVGDIGANIGIYTVLCAKALNCNVLAFEPDRTTVELLKENITINKIENQVKVFQAAVGAEAGILPFTKGLDAINHVQSSEKEDSTEVEVVTLDSAFKIKIPIALKIDIEGFETEALNGAVNLLQNSELKAILIELNGLGSRYGFKDEEIDKKLLSHGFAAYSYDPILRALTPLKYNINTVNYIYLRDFDFVLKRLKSANSFEIMGKRI